MRPPLEPGSLRKGRLLIKSYGQGSCPKHGVFEKKTANQGDSACPNLECCKERAVARVKALRKKRNN